MVLKLLMGIEFCSIYQKRKELSINFLSAFADTKHLFHTHNPLISEHTVAHIEIYGK